MAWPSSLQQVPLVSGFNSTGEQPIKRQAMESGLDRVTRMSSTSVRSNTFSIICTTEQLVDFWEFYNDEANGGADLVVIPMMTGNKILNHTCRFSSYPTMVPDGLEWRVSFNLETDEQLMDI